MWVLLLCAAAARADTVYEFIHRGDAHLNAGRCRQAITMWRKALAIKPGHATARVRIGIAFSKMGRLDEAERQFRSVIADHPRSDDAWHNPANG